MPRSSTYLPGFHARLEQLRNLGITYRDIAAMLSHEYGHAFTRNAISGLVFRMKLPRLLKPPPDRVRKRTPRHKPPPVLPPPVLPPPALPPPPTGAYSIFDLMPSSCRYPTGNGPFLFCGAEMAWPHRYCAWHSRLCYQKGSALHARAHAS